MEITQEFLKSVLDYDPETGLFTWKSRSFNKKKTNDIAGSRNPQGYQIITLKGKQHAASRLAWLYVYGVWPTHCIDHINTDRSDNRIVNLRDITNKENSQNRVKHRKGKLIGTSWYHPRKKWRVQLKVNGINYHVGYFFTEKEAHQVYCLNHFEWFGVYPLNKVD